MLLEEGCTAGYGNRQRRRLMRCHVIRVRKALCVSAVWTAAAKWPQA